MFEETRKYTEEVYVSKGELAQRLDLTGVVLDAVWKQVEDYRALLRRSFCFADLHADIVMTRALCAKLQQTTELLYRCPMQRHFSAAVQKKCPACRKLSALAAQGGRADGACTAAA